jgi:hypothetical protein
MGKMDSVNLDGEVTFLLMIKPWRCSIFYEKYYLFKNMRLITLMSHQHGTYNEMEIFLCNPYAKLIIRRIYQCQIIDETSILGIKYRSLFPNTNLKDYILNAKIEHKTSNYIWMNGYNQPLYSGVSTMNSNLGIKLPNYKI